MAIPHPSLNIVFRGFQPAKLGYGWPLVFSRASTATCFDATGKLITCVSGALRHDFDPLTGAYLGVLIEEQRINLVLRSQEFDNAAWTKSNATVTANAAVAIDGTTTADKLVEDNSNGVHLAYQDVTISAGATHSWSVVAEAAGRTQILLSVQNTSGTNGFSGFIDLSTGAITSFAAAGSGTATAARAVHLGNGRWRCSIAGIVGGSATTARCHVYLASAGTAGYAGNGASGVYLRDAQMEAGAFPSSIIPTTISQATRLADVLTVPVSAFPFSAAAGTVLVDFRPIAAGIQTEILRLYDGVSGGITLYRKANNTVCWNFGGQETSQVAVVAGQRLSVAACYSGSGDVMVIDGGAVNTKIDSTVPTGITTLALSGAAGGGLAQVGGHFHQVAYFTRRQSNTDQQNLSL